MKITLSGGEPTLNPQLAEYVRLAAAKSRFPVQVQSNAYNRFTTEDAEVLSLLAGTAAISIQNARLFEAEHQQRMRAEALAQLATQLNAQIELDAVLQITCKETAHALNTPAASIYLFDEASNTLLFGGDYGLPTFFGQCVTPMPRAIFDAFNTRPDRCFSYFDESYSENSRFIDPAPGAVTDAFEVFAGAQRIERYLYLCDPRFANTGDSSLLKIFMGTPERGGRDLAGLVAQHPEICELAETLVSDLVGEKVREECEKAGMPPLDKNPTELKRVVDLTCQLVAHIQQEIRMVDFWSDPPSREEVEKWLYRTLRQSRLVPKGKAEAVATQLMQIAENRKRWLVT